MEREDQIMKNYEEKQDLLRRIATLKKMNEVAASAWQPEISGQVEQLKMKEKKLLDTDNINLEGPVVQQIKNYNAPEVNKNKSKDAEHVLDAKNKGKQKEVGTKINESVKIVQIQDYMSLSNL